jgi:hypothetical protein
VRKEKDDGCKEKDDERQVAPRGEL